MPCLIHFSHAFYLYYLVLSLFFFVKTEIFHLYSSFIENDMDLLGLPHLVSRGSFEALPFLLSISSYRIGYWAFCFFPSSLGPFKDHSNSLKRAIPPWLTLSHCPILWWVNVSFSLFFIGILSLWAIAWAMLIYSLSLWDVVPLPYFLYFLISFSWFGLGFSIVGPLGPYYKKIDIDIQPPKHVNCSTINV